MCVLCRQCVENELYIIGYVKSTWDDVWVTSDSLLERNISRTTAHNVRIIHICSENMRMTFKYANNMWTMSRCDMQRKPSRQIILQIIYMILKWNNWTLLWQILFNNQFLSQWKDSLELWWPWRVLQMMCGWPVNLQTTCGWHIDDVCPPPTKSVYHVYMCGQHLHAIDNVRLYRECVETEL